MRTPETAWVEPVLVKTGCSSIVAQIDVALEQLQQRRDRIVAEKPSAHRAARLAELYEREVHLWSALYEHARLRVYWRAALAAEAYARNCAQLWRCRAATELPSAKQPHVAYEVGQR